MWGGGRGREVQSHDYHPALRTSAHACTGQPSAAPEAAPPAAQAPGGLGRAVLRPPWCAGLLRSEQEGFSSRCTEPPHAPCSGPGAWCRTWGVTDPVESRRSHPHPAAGPHAQARPQRRRGLKTPGSHHQGRTRRRPSRLPRRPQPKHRHTNRNQQRPGAPRPPLPAHAPARVRTPKRVPTIRGVPMTRKPGGIISEMEAAVEISTQRR